MKMPQSSMPKHCTVIFFVYRNLLFFHKIQGKAFTLHLDFKHFSVLCISNQAKIVLK